MRFTRRTIEFIRGTFSLTLVSETATGPRMVLNGGWWALEHRSWSGVRYETVGRATRSDLIEYAHLNVNPQTGPGVVRGQVTA